MRSNLPQISARATRWKLLDCAIQVHKILISAQSSSTPLPDFGLFTCGLGMPGSWIALRNKP
jgi:hypothetical protein